MRVLNPLASQHQNPRSMDENQLMSFPDALQIVINDFICKNRLHFVIGYKIFNLK